MLGPVTPTEGTAAAQLRGRNRPSVRIGINRVKDGFTLGALRVSGGPPSTATRTAAAAGPISGVASRGRRGATLFDRSRSGQGVLERLRGQVRSVSPLTAGLNGAATTPDSAGSGARQPAAATPAAEREEHRLSIFVARQSSLRQGFLRLDNSSRFLLAQSNPRRTSFGFGLRAADDKGLFGGGLSLFGGGINLFG